MGAGCPTVDIDVGDDAKADSMSANDRRLKLIYMISVKLECAAAESD